MSSDWYKKLSLMSCCVAHMVECSAAFLQLSENCGHHSWCSLHKAQPSHHDQQTDFEVGLDCLSLKQEYQSDMMVSVHEALCTSEAPPWKWYIYRLEANEGHLWAPIQHSQTFICHQKDVLRYSEQIVVVRCRMQVVQQTGRYSNRVDMRWMHVTMSWTYPAVVNDVLFVTVLVELARSENIRYVLF